ncbi:MAG: hypothetical protein KJ955_02225 [Nanoarchaeota archaeon]|nr:hypothetical protein [Nanoarchaeota archaeon]
MSFAKLFTSIGSAGFSGSSLGSSGNFDGGVYGLGRGSPYHPSPVNLSLSCRSVDIPDAGLCFERPYAPVQPKRETLKLELRQEETSLRIKYERSLTFKDIKFQEKQEFDYNKKTSLLDIIRERIS